MKRINRRTVLRGLGAAIALPWLEAMGHSATDLYRYGTAGANRLAFMYIPNGVIGSKWFPESAGPEFEFGESLKPLEPLRSDVTVISGLNRTYLTGEPHSQAGSCWLTSAKPNERVDGVNAIDVTLDQIIAKSAGTATPFPSIELSCNSFIDNVEPKIFDSISWYGPGYDAKSQNDPRKVFSRLFGETSSIKKSILDTVLEDANRLNRTLGKSDRRKMDEYLNSVRSVENRIAKQKASKGSLGKIDYQVPDQLPKNRGEYIRMMGDLMVLAFQTDQTRVATMMVGPERWETPQFYEGVFDKPVSHHVMTHDTTEDDRVAKIDRFHVEQYAYLVNKLKSIQEGESSLLDNCTFVLGSGLGNGAQHSYEQLPIVIAGHGSGAHNSGTHIKAAEGTRLANLWLSLGNMMGLDIDQFADSTGTLNGFLK
jgi:hypothetical protein|eukprot:COSAG05_NODE_542_length_8791_cov_2.597906_5_plen_425_part_00